ncbi:MAG: TolC family protein [Ignavibacteriales bacterium]
MKKIARVIVAALAAMCVASAGALASGEPAARGGSAAGGESPALTLDQAYARALECSTVVAQSKLAVKQAELEADEAVKTARGIEEEYVTTWELALVKYYNPDSAKSALETARMSNDLTAKSLRLSVAESYYGVLKADAMLKAQQAGLKRAEEQLKTAQAMFDAGMVARTDVLAAEVGVSGARVGVASASKALTMARMGLNQLLGYDLSREMSLSAGFRYTGLSPVDLSGVVSLAMEKRLDIRSASEAVRLATLYRDLSLKHFTPNVWTVRQAEINIESKALSHDLARQAAELQIRLGYETLLEADERYQLTQKTLEQAQENLRLATLRYEAGVGTSLEVTTADSMLREIEAQAIQAQFDYALATAKFDFLREGGQLATTGS